MGKRIAYLRHKKGLTQAALGKRLGLSASAIGMYEQGRREPAIGTLISLAREFGVTTDYLLTGSIPKELHSGAVDRRIPKRIGRILYIGTAWLVDEEDC